MEYDDVYLTPYLMIRSGTRLQPGLVTIIGPRSVTPHALTLLWAQTGRAGCLWARAHLSLAGMLSLFFLLTISIPELL